MCWRRARRAANRFLCEPLFGPRSHSLSYPRGEGSEQAGDPNQRMLALLTVVAFLACPCRVVVVVRATEAHRHDVFSVFLDLAGRQVDSTPVTEVFVVFWIFPPALRDCSVLLRPSFTIALKKFGLVLLVVLGLLLGDLVLVLLVPLGLPVLVLLVVLGLLLGDLVLVLLVVLDHAFSTPGLKTISHVLALVELFSRQITFASFAMLGWCR